ncbi:MAG TPA: hypothetical protein VGP72_04210 [Planctomycetota bacterium]|jgi:hypothetical protein
MKVYGVVAGFVLALACTGAWCAEGGGHGDKDTKGGKPTLGTLSEKPADSKVENLVALLKVQPKEGKEAKTLNLIAAPGEVATKLADLAKKGAKVVVKGEPTADGTGINVTKVTEASDKGDHKKHDK